MIFNRMMNRGALEHPSAGRFSFKNLGVSDEDHRRFVHQEYENRMYMARQIYQEPDDVKAPRRYATRAQYAPRVDYVVQRPQDFYLEWAREDGVVPLEEQEQGQEQAPVGQRRARGRGRVVKKKIIEYYTDSDEYDDDDEDSDDEEVYYR